MADLAAVLPLADAVLLEGYVLYPYRAGDVKNRVRWQFGVLVPPAFAEHDPSERSWLQTDCLVEGQRAELTIRVRFLHARRRTTEVRGVAVAALDVGDATYLPLDEAAVEEHEIRLGVAERRAERAIALDAGTAHEHLHDADGTVAGELVHRWAALTARLQVEVEPQRGPYGVSRVRVRVDNRTPWPASDPDPASGPEPLRPEALRPEALRHSLIAAHVVLGVERGRFVSQLDPPEWARGYVAECENVGVFPVLAGAPGSADLVLASPIILYDHAEVAPESEVAFYDATEMDEMLTLRAMTLTDEEKRQSRGSDPRAARIVDQVDHLPPELTQRLHGAIRSMRAVARPVEPDLGAVDRPPWWDPGADGGVDPDTDEVLVGGVAVRRGAQVRLWPGARRADAQDMFLEGRLAHVEAVLHDVDGQVHLAVALDDLVEDGHNPHGRFLYFAPDELEVAARCAP